MLTTWGVTVWSGLSVTGTHVSDPIPSLADADFIRIFAVVDVQSFTYLQLGVDLLVEPATWLALNDASTTPWSQRWAANVTYTTVIGAPVTASNQRSSQLALPAHGVRFRVVVSGASGTPGSLTLHAQALRRKAGSYQNR